MYLTLVLIFKWYLGDATEILYELQFFFFFFIHPGFYSMKMSISVFYHIFYLVRILNIEKQIENLKGLKYIFVTIYLHHIENFIDKL